MGCTHRCGLGSDRWVGLEGSDCGIECLGFGRKPCGHSIPLTGIGMHRLS